jgi:nicotinate-nucleotide adenylyltransferase
MSLIDFIKKNNLDVKKEIVFFGGSFNPWHAGHSSCLELIPENKTLIVMPDHNPFKELIESQQKETSLSQIKEVLRIFNKKIYLFDEFYLRNEKNPTSQWVEKLKAEFPQIKISLLMGFDSFISIDRWIEGENLLKNINSLYIVDRLNDNKIKTKQLEVLSQYSELKIDFLGEHPFEHLSSTAIRAQ